MSKRKYTNLKEMEPLILAMRSDGMTLQEIADELGFILFSSQTKKEQPTIRLLS